MKIGERDRKGRLWTAARERAIRKALSAKYGKNGFRHHKSASTASRLDAKIHRIVEATVQRYIEDLLD